MFTWFKFTSLKSIPFCMSLCCIARRGGGAAAPPAHGELLAATHPTQPPCEYGLHHRRPKWVDVSWDKKTLHLKIEKRQKTHRNHIGMTWNHIEITSKSLEMSRLCSMCVSCGLSQTRDAACSKPGPLKVLKEAKARPNALAQARSLHKDRDFEEDFQRILKGFHHISSYFIHFKT